MSFLVTTSVIQESPVRPLFKIMTKIIEAKGSAFQDRMHPVLKRAVSCLSDIRYYFEQRLAAWGPFYKRGLSLIPAYI